MKIVFVGDKRSPFNLQDAEILSKKYLVTPIFVDLLGKDYLGMFRAGIFKIIPGILASDVSITWFADYHALFVVFFTKLFRKKSIVIVGGHEVCNMPEINYGYQTLAFRGYVSRWILRNTDKIVVPSDSYAQKVFFLINRPSVVIPNTAAPNLYAFHNTERDLGVVMVANQYLPTKEYILLKGISIYNSIASKFPDCKFYLIGNVSPEVKEEFTKISYLDSKNHDEVLRCLPRFKVYCQLSYTESFGVALLEAIQSGCIPVVTNKDGMKELVEDQGYQIPYGGVEAGVIAVKQALESKENRDKIAVNYQKVYSKENRGTNFEKLIEDLR